MPMGRFCVWQVYRFVHQGRQEVKCVTDALEVQIRGVATPIPNQWKKFIANAQNKTFWVFFFFFCFLEGTWLGDIEVEDLVIGGFTDRVSCQWHCSEYIEELHSDHEEADTRLLLHATTALLWYSYPTQTWLTYISHFSVSWVVTNFGFQFWTGS